MISHSLTYQAQIESIKFTKACFILTKKYMKTNNKWKSDKKGTIQHKCVKNNII
jgi:hypothetical protein